MRVTVQALFRQKPPSANVYGHRALGSRRNCACDYGSGSAPHASVQKTGGRFRDMDVGSLAGVSGHAAGCEGGSRSAFPVGHQPADRTRVARVASTGRYARVAVLRRGRVYRQEPVVAGDGRSLRLPPPREFSPSPGRACRRHCRVCAHRRRAGGHAAGRGGLSEPVVGGEQRTAALARPDDSRQRIQFRRNRRWHAGGSTEPRLQGDRGERR